MSQEINNSKKHGGGPKTPEGKRRSSLNAVRHGFTAETIVLPNEDKEAFEELLADYIYDFAPETRFELDLVHELVATRWRLQRIWGLENTVLQIGMKRTSEAAKAEFNDVKPDVRTALAFIEMSGESKAIQLMNRYEARLTRRFHQIQMELKALAAARKAEEKAARAESKKSLPNELPEPRPIRPIDSKTPPAPVKTPPKQEDAA